MTPLPVSDIKFIKPKHAQDENHHNPALEHADSPLPKRRNTGPQDTPLIPKEALYSAIHKTLPNATLFTIVSFSSSLPSSLREESISGEQPAASPSSVYSTPDELVPSIITDINDHRDDDLPSPLIFYSHEYRSLDDQSLKDMVREVFLSIKISQGDIERVERCTRSQRESSIWYEQRYGRLTASSFHDVLVRRKTTNPDSLTKTLLSQPQDLSLIPAVKWGG